MNDSGIKAGIIDRILEEAQRVNASLHSEIDELRVLEYKKAEFRDACEDAVLMIRLGANVIARITKQVRAEPNITGRESSRPGGV